MPGTLTLPLKVAAKVITAANPVPVPNLTDDPFKKVAALEKGIHVHWALPDRLTHGKLVPDHGKNVSVLPGVPDLWLVIRFNPCLAQAPGSPLPPKRMWRAWVVDSVAQTVTDLASWTPPKARDTTVVHTLAGLLPNASAIGRPGYGILAADQKFDIAMAAYYPESRKRFGFYDDVKDLAGQKGTVTYAVVGWFSENGWDPLYSSPTRAQMLNDWQVAHHVRSDSMAEMAVSAMDPGTAWKPSWTPRGLELTGESVPPPAKILDVKNANARGGTLESRMKSQSLMQAAFPPAPAGKMAPLTVAVDSLTAYFGPEQILCHGAVVEVPLSGTNMVGASPADDDVRLYPSIKRAMSEMAAASGASDQQFDFVEMMLQDIDAQKQSLSGVVDMPGAIHALSFQSVPGKSRFYARMDVVPPAPPWQNPAYFDIGSISFVTSQTASGYWPLMQTRSAYELDAAVLAGIPPLYRNDPPPAIPTDAEADGWVQNTFAPKFAAAISGANSKGTPIDTRLIFVSDKRGNAQSQTLGRTADRSGTDGGGWWLDTADADAMREFRKSVAGAVIHLPDPNNLLEVPGPRWNRPWSPQLVLHGISRSYRAGFDARFSADGYLNARLGGDTVTAVSVGSNNRVFARDLMDNANAAFSIPGLPGDARLLVQESMLLDPSNTTLMGALSVGTNATQQAKDAAGKQFLAGVRGLWLSRDAATAANAADKLDAIGVFGKMLDNNAVAYWQDPRDPLFVDMKYNYVASPMATGWRLDQDQVEFTRVQGTPVNPQVTGFTERVKVTASVPKILESTLITRQSVNTTGGLTTAQDPPGGINSDTFLKMDVVTAPLTKLDASLIAGGQRERSGALAMEQLELVDIFGIGRSWKASLPSTAAVGDPSKTYWTDLTPRLPYWSRLQFRLQSAQDVTKEATPLDPPICGVLVPDFVEHALEVFDGDGKAIGQLTSDYLSQGHQPGDLLQVRWQLHPWVAADLNVPANDLNAIQNPKLRALVTALTQQSAAVGNDISAWYETGLTAMLRIIDTVRGTLDPSVKTPDRRVKLIGEPVLLMAARLELQSTGETSPTALATTEPAPMTGNLPVVKVRVGDVTRPDDGVLGCFLEAQGKFAPVSTVAKDKAILNTLQLNLPAFHTAPRAEPANHPFIANQPAEFPLTQNQAADILILADPRGGLYGTAGVLPRKKITMPREFIDATLRSLEPTFQIGPVLTSSRLGTVKPFVPPPQIEGYSAEFVYEQQDPQTQMETFPDTEVAPVPPLGELPSGRVTLSDGWIRVYKAKAGS
jgi:hypothetical protein